ncbi:MAG: hypothetical protein HKO86_07490 [Gammaproteobacteria bacterium]|nr:hypothetical protein [Gammaproteobacteria bacterium]NNL07552.1 hypothetical protein [Gammaproteobacteria bacterium]
MPDLIHIRNVNAARGAMPDSALHFITLETGYAQPGAVRRGSVVTKL